MDVYENSLHDEILRIVRAEHWNPFQVLGPHPSIRGGAPAVCVRVFRPDAREAFVITDSDPGSPVPMEKQHPDGFFEAVLPRDEGGVRTVFASSTGGTGNPTSRIRTPSRRSSPISIST